MALKLYRPVLASALLMASSVVSAFGQNYSQPGYGNQPGISGQLDNLVAPIALYPDALLSQVLVASTYPQQLAEARQWLAQTGYMQGQQRLEAARQQNWDPSVQALVAFPDVLQLLTEDPQWTADLGNAFLNGQSDVMNAVQNLRERAQQSGRLQSTPQQTVNVDNYNGERAIEIVPANPEVVYVPTYDPAYIWGAPAYGYYPPLYYPSVGFGFGSGISIGAFFGGYRGGFGNWGWGPSWHNRTVIVNNDFFYRNRFNGYRGYAGRSQYQAPAAGYMRQFSNQTPQQQYSRPQAVQPRAFQQTPQRQVPQPRQFQQPAPQGRGQQSFTNQQASPRSGRNR